jgi:hypothetical protein
MKSLSTLAATAALFICLSAPAQAGDWASQGTIGPWRMAASASACEARAAYKNGTELIFAINARGANMIAIANPNWHIPKGSYEVVVQVDRSTPDKAKADADDDFLVFQFALNEPTINLLSYGRTLFLTVGQQNYQYDLVRSEAMLKALIACAGPRMASGNPFAGTPSAKAPPPGFTEVVPSNPFPETASNPYRRM